MSLTLTTPLNVAAGAQTGFAVGTMVLTQDAAPTTFGKKYTVSSFTGLLAGYRVHAISDPNMVTLSRAAVLKPLPPVNPVTLRYGPIPKNVHTVIVNKGVNCAANQQPEVMNLKLYMEIPAGSDAFDPVNVRGGIQLLIQALSSISAGVGDTAVTGVP